MSEVNFVQYLNNNFSEKIERMSNDDAAEIQEAFNLFDTVADGKIAASQIGDVVRSLGQNPTEEEIQKCCTQLEPSDRVSFDTFIPILQSLSKLSSSKKNQSDEFISGLQNFDKEGNGTINSAELRHLLVTLGEPLTEDEVETLLQGQEDDQGNIDYEKLIKMVMEG